MLKHKVVLIFLVLAASLYSASVFAAELKYDNAWLRLGFYKGSLWGGWVSQVAQPEFFIHPDGRRDPQAELEATIEAFRSPVLTHHVEAEKIEVTDNPTSEQLERSKKAHPICRYPARLKYLKEKIPAFEKSLPAITCGRLENFLKRTDASKVSLVFSSYYMGSPGSSFGHTLLRIQHRKFANSGSELLDTAIGFAAAPTTSNPVLYAVFGLTGFFPGLFSAEAFYRKVREYNDQESRDLWSYGLNLSPDEIERLMLVIWEVGSTYFDYYYFTVNCGTLLMDILDAAAPRLNLRDKIPFYVVPSDVIRAVMAEPGFVTTKTYRPSVREQFERKYRSMSASEEALFWNLVETEDAKVLSGQSDEMRVHLLDTWADYLEYRSARDLIAGDEIALRAKQKALIARSEIPLPSKRDTSPPEGAAPELSHDVRQLSVAGGSSRELGGAVSLKYRFALHGLTNADYGLPPNTEITFFELGSFIDVGPKPKIYFDDFTLFRVTNLNPWKPYEKPVSFRAGLEMATHSDPDFIQPVMGTDYTLAAGAGVTLPLFTDRLYFFTLAKVEWAMSPDYLQSWHRFSIGPEWGLLWNLSRETKILFESSYFYRLNANKTEFFEAALEAQTTLDTKWSLFARASTNSIDTRILGGVRFFH